MIQLLADAIDAHRGLFDGILTEPHRHDRDRR